jgi:hypothetical protein
MIRLNARLDIDVVRQMLFNAIANQFHIAFFEIIAIDPI